MAEQNTYKRTVAGSVGAGMGAIFNASGRTYYILEHKTQSKYHNIGESQKIIVDQIEMGRDASCQVRWEDTPEFEMVSRKHAAIVRDGQNWQLVHLSQSNPTLVNGHPIQGTYYLQSGDEIQLANGGPRMGFIVPQGSQALTSSIKLTERMNLFRQQALAPYKRALWTMAVLLVLVIAGFGYWNYKLTQDNKALMTQAQELILQSNNLDSQIDQLQKDLAATDETNAQAKAELQKKITELENEKQQVQTKYTTVYRDNPEMQKEIDALKQQIGNSLTAPNEDITNPDTPATEETNATGKENPEASDGTAGDVRAYYGSIYRIIVDRITIEDRDGVSHQSNIPTSQIDCGTGFITPNGTFVTARQNIQPWVYVDGNTPADNWRRRLALVYALGANVIIEYSAYSTDGAAKRMTFKSTDFSMPTGGDIVSAKLTVTEEEITYIEDLGFFGKTVSRKKLLSDGLEIKHISSAARAYATLAGTERKGIPTDAGASNSIAGGQQLDIVYYSSSDVQNLASSATYKTVNTEKTDNNAGGTIVLQSGPGSSAFGAPAFIREDDGSLRVVGVYVGDRKIVPIHSIQ